MKNFMDKSFRNIKALLFDFGGTLDADGLTWKEQFYPIYQKFGFDWTEETFAPYFYFADDTITEKKLKNMPFEKTIRLQVGLLLKKAGKYDKKLSERIADEYLAMSRANLKRNKPLLLNLRKKYRLGIVSNFYGNLPAILKEEGYDKIFDAIIDSNRVGFMKPDPEIFQEALDQLEASPQGSLFIGDSFKRDMLGAKGMGMRHILVLHKNTKGWKTCCPEDRTIQSVQDLAGILL